MQPLFQPFELKSIAVRKKNECAGKLVSNFEYRNNSLNQGHNQDHNIFISGDDEDKFLSFVKILFLFPSFLQF